MVAFITCNSNLVPFLEDLCGSNPCRFGFSIFLSFYWNRSDDLGINSPALWPTELVHIVSNVNMCVLYSDWLFFQIQQARKSCLGLLRLIDVANITSQVIVWYLCSIFGSSICSRCTEGWRWVAVCHSIDIIDLSVYVSIHLSTAGLPKILIWRLYLPGVEPGISRS